MDPKIPIEKLPGIGKYYFYKLKRLNIETLEDLLYHFPFRYDDFSKISPIDNLADGDIISIQGIILEIKNFRSRYGKFITRAIITDESGTIEVIWFNQPYLTNTLKEGTPISLSGKVRLNGRHYQLVAPQFEVLRSNQHLQPEASGPLTQTLHTGRLVPVYPETEGLSSKWIRAKIAKYLPVYLENQKDYMPAEIIEKYHFTDFEDALFKIHFPKNNKDILKARKRLAFDELFLIQFLANIRRRQWQSKRKAYKMTVNKDSIQKFIKNLPFKLTSAQNRASGEILRDMQKRIPANRLLEGDVGSGKTVVAAIAAYVSHLNGFETVFAAPTEILAFQHHRTLGEIFKTFKIKVGIWTKSKKIKGEITCGTHALLSSFKTKEKVGLVVVDEQHRFGVAQRAKLFLNQAEESSPHLLTMTATPIPRTLALTLYGDLDLSILDEMPKGRLKISTFSVPNLKRNDAYQFIEREIKKGRQAFIITPFVEQSETMISIKAAVDEFEKLKKIFPKNIKLGLLHGRLKSSEKEKIINEFKNSQINILVATPVVEVGIDVPNATIMLIESADRFGLAQLHQLRGRVGRGEHKSYCLLFTDSNSPRSIKRLKSLEKINVGFKLAEIDLEMRGPGEMFGLKQSGFANLKIADLSDHQAISTAQTEARNLFEADPELKKHPHLAQRLTRLQFEFAEPN